MNSKRGSSRSALPEHSLKKRKALRYVENQSQICTLEFVDSLDEQKRLEELLEETSKPPLADDLEKKKNVHWLLRSPFRYPPLRFGSRFGTVNQRGILYLSETAEGLEAEMAFYAREFYRAMSKPPPEPVRRTFSVLEICVSTRRCVFTSEARNHRQLVDPASWEASRRFGDRAREQGADVIRYPSARISAKIIGGEQRHHNLAVLAPGPVSEIEPEIRGSYQTVTNEKELVLGRHWQAPIVFSAESLSPAPREFA